MKLLVDGVAFQAGDGRRTRAWRSLLPCLAADGRFEVHLLDRGNAPPVPGARFIPFPSHHGAFPAADSFQVERLCRHLAIDVFMSTGWTTPVATPSLLFVDATLPGVPSLTGRGPDLLEREVAISHARRYACSSEWASAQLQRLYPEIPADRISVCRYGADPAHFHPGRGDEAVAFLDRLGLRQPCLLLAAPPGGGGLAQAFLDGLPGLADAGFDILCLDGGPDWAGEVRARLPRGVSGAWASPDGPARGAALAGASALVLLDGGAGSGQYVAEAMAAGCPVVTTTGGEPAEYAGPAGLPAAGASVAAIRDALRALHDRATGAALRQEGLDRAARLRWDAMAAGIGDQLAALHEEAAAGVFDDFAREWTRLRQLQVDLDFGGRAAARQ